jgi:hypothetical protein
MNDTENAIPDVPALIDLPVHREDYLSQQRVDELCKMLWKKEPWCIVKLASAEDDKGHLFRFDEFVAYKLWPSLRAIKQFFNAQAEQGEFEKLSDLQMCDIIYEVERRVRIVTGIDDFPQASHWRRPRRGRSPSMGTFVITYLLVTRLMTNILRRAILPKHTQHNIWQIIRPCVKSTLNSYSPIVRC